MTDPLDVYCPTCGARKDAPCVSVMNRTPVHKPHLQRITAARRHGEIAPRRKTKPTRTSVGTTARREVAERSGGICEAKTPVCTGRALHVHHVITRARGGKNLPENLLHVCDDCHIFIHANPHDSTERGLLRSAPRKPILLVEQVGGGLDVPENREN